jgi:hypothetical protein
MESVNTKFLGLHIDNHLNWKNYIDQIFQKLSGAYYAILELLQYVGEACVPRLHNYLNKCWQNALYLNLGEVHEWYLSLKKEIEVILIILEV